MRSARPNLAILLAGAGALHLGLTPTHADTHLAVGTAFAVVGSAQLAVAAGLLTPSRRTVGMALVAAAAPLVAYALSRSVGLPLVGREAVGAADLLAGALELGVVVGAVIGPRRASPPARSMRPALPVAAAVAFLTVAALVSPSARHAHRETSSAVAHEHAAGGDAGERPTGGPGSTAPHTSDHPSDAASDDAASDDAPSDDAAGSDHNNHAATDSCTTGPTAAEERAAADLADRTRATLSRFTAVGVAETAGYRRTDGPGPQDSHWLNPTFALDGAVLDPGRPESLVYLTARNGQQYLIGAMFLNDDRATEPPRPGGCATTWHSHPGVCLGPSRIDVPGAEGCPTGTREGDTTDMLHVWLIDVPGGPFADIGSLDPVQLAVAAREAYGL